MPRHKSKPTDNVNLRINLKLQEDVISLLEKHKGRIRYSNFSEFVEGAMEHELAYQTDLLNDRIPAYGAILQRPPAP